MNISVSAGDPVVVTVGGEVDLGNSASLAAAIGEALEQDAVSSVEVDLGAVTFLDSSGIAALLKGRRLADDAGVDYRVTGMHGIVRQVLELTGVLDHLTGRSD
jgi:anti-anti-sigma factor